MTGRTPRTAPEETRGFGFTVVSRLPGRLGRTGVIQTPHGTIATPAFVAVGTKATVKAVLPESMADLGAQAVLANAYHLYLQPGADVVQAAGGIVTDWQGNPAHGGGCVIAAASAELHAAALAILAA